MKRKELEEALGYISKIMTENAAYLVELDARFGDGDLGISMSQGFEAVYKYIQTEKETDLGKILMDCSIEFNEAAPSTLGTIISFGFMGMSKMLNGKEEISFLELVEAMEGGMDLLMKRGKANPGDKTIIDSLLPGIKALKAGEYKDPKTAFEQAYKAAKKGVEKTRTMKGKHGRAAYYGDKTIGEIDGGAVVGMLLFEALCNDTKMKG